MHRIVAALNIVQGVESISLQVLESVLVVL